MSKTSFPLVSVIITTKNEEKNIQNCLDSILSQTYKNIEIIVVDNNSTDKTKEICMQFALSERSESNGSLRSRQGGRSNPVENRPHPSFSFHTFGPERSAQRNYGINKAQGKYIIYLDADMIVSENVISECVNKIESDEKAVGLYIPEIVTGDSFWCKVRRYERSFYNGTVIDCVRFFTKDAFEKVKGFDETMSGPEDWDFDKKIRGIGKTNIIKSEIFHNESNFNLIKYLDKKAYYAKSFDKYISKWGSNDKDIKKQLGVWYRYFGVFIEDDKWKKIVSHPTLFFGMFFLRFLIGVKYLDTKFK